LCRAYFRLRPRPLLVRRQITDAYYDREDGEECGKSQGDLMRRRVLDAVRRTLLLVGHAHEARDEPVVVPVSEDAVPDVFCAFAHAQAPYLSRPRWNARVDWPTVPLLRGGRELTWLVTCQTALAEAALTEPEESEDVQVSTA